MVPANATNNSGQKLVTPAKPRPVAIINKLDPNNSRRLE